MQERVERWLSYWVAKPISWLIFWAWLALKGAWFRAAWYANRLPEKWAAWRAKRVINNAPTVNVELPAKRVNRRQEA